MITQHTGFYYRSKFSTVASGRLLQLFWSVNHLCFFFFSQVSPPALRTERTNSGKQTCREINTEAQRHTISSVTASAALDCCPPFSISHLQALEEAQSRLQPPQHLCLDLRFPLHRHHFDFTVCKKWQPSCIFPAFYRGNWAKFHSGSDGNLWENMRNKALSL